MRFNIPAVVDSLIARKDINRETNDYQAHLGNRPPWIDAPFPKVAHQYKMDVREARKLVAAIKKLDPSIQAAVVSELANRATLDQRSMPRFGGLKLTEAAAKELNKEANRLAIDVGFKSGQPFPIHPVG